MQDGSADGDGPIALRGQSAVLVSSAHHEQIKTRVLVTEGHHKNTPGTHSCG